MPFISIFNVVLCVFTLFICIAWSITLMLSNILLHYIPDEKFMGTKFSCVRSWIS